MKPINWIVIAITIFAEFVFWICVRAGSKYDKQIEKDLERPDLIQVKSNGGTYGKY